MHACSWIIQANEQWCENFPEVMNTNALEEYKTTITPYCMSDDGKYHYTIESRQVGLAGHVAAGVGLW